MRFTVGFSVVMISIWLSACGQHDSSREEVAKQSESTSASTIAYINGCTNCHEIGSSIQGPSWRGIAKRYKGRQDAKAYLIDRIKNGGEPNWSKITGGADMHAYHDRVSEDHLNRIVDYILSAR